MNKIRFRNFFFNFLIVIIIFLIDRISKIYILKLAEIESAFDVYVTPFLNFYLIWNKGIAFGLFSFNEQSIYDIITLIIIIIIIVIFIMIIKTKGIKKYSLLFVFGGSLGNLYDRVFYSAVPDFIDLHIGNFHWFIFNVADIFITLGVLCLIYAEIFHNKEANDKNN
tara:strand:+ start:7 stop:507 length:501 start_codon:yes stop_codon:yes gene_type:complete